MGHTHGQSHHRGRIREHERHAFRQRRICELDRYPAADAGKIGSHRRRRASRGFVALAMIGKIDRGIKMLGLIAASCGAARS
jgi:hypothetical protein